jgi:MinD-like ATPase involved in chromosome partitioning or flagellar assembly
VISEERSEAARAFQKLAATYAEHEEQEVPTAPEPAMSDRAHKRRFAWRS